MTQEMKELIDRELDDAGYLTSHQQLRYAMPASVALVAENDAATLVCGDRAVTNATIASGFATLNLTFPAEVSGYRRSSRTRRDFRQFRRIKQPKKGETK